MTSERTLRIGTRASKLARWQSDWTASRLQALGVAVEIVEITTRGDVETRPLAEVGGSGLFTKAIQRELLEGRVDLAVHSLKDLPTESVDGLTLACVPPREDATDLLIARATTTLDALPPGAIVGTGSLRRKAQLLHHRDDLDVRSIRGNLDTRLARLQQGDYDAILLAAAGVRRLGWDTLHAWPIPPDVMLPAVGQGALGLETRSEDLEVIAALAPLQHDPSRWAVTAERSLLRTLRAGCLAPVGAHARMVDGRLRLDAIVLDGRGSESLAMSHTTDPGEITPEVAERLGRVLGERLREEGADRLIAAARRTDDATLDPPSSSA